MSKYSKFLDLKIPKESFNKMQERVVDEKETIPTTSLTTQFAMTPKPQDNERII